MTVNLEWKNLTYSVERKINSKTKWWKFYEKNSRIEKQIILNNVSGCARSGELIAILGSSGAGKTTLLAAISQRLRGGEIKGDIILNGTLISCKELTKISAFIPQYDIALPKLTAREHLYYTAIMKMDKHSSKQFRTNRIDIVLQNLGLQNCARTRIAKLSGGERKKLSLAGELLTEPSVLFCDEPTTGLDSYNALSVVTTLKNLTKPSRRKGKLMETNDNHIYNYENSDLIELSSTEVYDKTNEDDIEVGRSIVTNHKYKKISIVPKAVICSIHQPTSDIFQCFSHIVLMNSGRIVYQGTMQEAETFFFSLNLKCPSNFNPAEHYVKLVKTNDENDMEDNFIVDKIYKKYLNNQDSLTFQVNGNGKIISNYSNDKKKIKTKNQRIGWCMQILLLISRFGINAKRSLYETGIRILFSLSTAASIALIYLSIDTKVQTSIQGVQGAIMVIATETLFSNSYGVLNKIPSHMPIIRREVGEKMYYLSAYYVANFITNIPLLFIESALFIGIFGVTVPFINSFLQYIQITLLVFMCSICANSYGFFLSALFSTVELATEFAAPIDLFMLILGGLYINLNSFKYIKFLSIFYYTNEGLTYYVWKDVEEIQCPETLGTPCAGNGLAVLEEYGYGTTPVTILKDYLGLLILTIVMHSIGYIGLTKQLRKTGFY